MFVTRCSKRGIQYAVWRKHNLPRIPDRFLDCVVYLYPSEAEAEDGKAMGGSGFLAHVTISDDPKLILKFVITNRHLIESGATTVRVNTKDGFFHVIPLDGESWIYHPEHDDIAICPISLSAKDHQFTSIGIENFVSRESAKEHGIGPGDDVFLVGRFVNQEGRLRNVPSVRFGTIAQMADEPVLQSDGKYQDTILVEGRSISGFSGSPVFVSLSPYPLAFANVPQEVLSQLPIFTKGRNPYGPLGPWLLGINYCHTFSRDRVHSENSQRPVNDDWYVPSNTGMMGVVPAWKIKEILDGKQMKPMLDQATESAKNMKRASNVKLDGASAPPSNGENPTHREDFRNLLDAAAKKLPQGD